MRLKQLSKSLFKWWVNESDVTTICQCIHSWIFKWKIEKLSCEGMGGGRVYLLYTYSLLLFLTYTHETHVPFLLSLIRLSYHTIHISSFIHSTFFTYTFLHPIHLTFHLLTFSRLLSKSENLIYLKKYLPKDFNGFSMNRTRSVKCTEREKCEQKKYVHKGI